MLHDRLTDGLSADIQHDVTNACRHTRYRGSQIIVSRDDTDGDVFIVVSGQVRVIAYGPNGREVSFRDIGPGDTFGELSALDHKPRSASVVALRESVLARITQADFESLLRRHWPLCQRVFARLAASVREMTERYYELSTLNVQQRLAAELLRIASTESGGEPLSDSRIALRALPTQAELAARIGTYREQVTRELKALVSKGFVSQRAGSWVIEDLHGLADLTKATKPD
jgi:CRP/FNR family transcriptional regulator, cyclic AMP receptor protein